MKLLSIYLIIVLGFMCILFTMAFIEYCVSRTKENKFKKWWRNNVIGENL